MSPVSQGGCLCGGVRYEVEGPLRGIIACHCSQCRRTSGHFLVATAAATETFRLVEAGTLRWYRSSEGAERGFCGRCGGNLFWREVPSTGSISITAGTLDGPTGLRIDKHIFVADKGDYYDIDDGAPQLAGW